MVCIGYEQVVSQHSSLLAPMAVDCVLRVAEDCKK